MQWDPTKMELSSIKYIPWQSPSRSLHQGTPFLGLGLALKTKFNLVPFNDLFHAMTELISYGSTTLSAKSGTVIKKIYNYKIYTPRSCNVKVQIVIMYIMSFIKCY